jgi:hypothetical protein
MRPWSALCCGDNGNYMKLKFHFNPITTLRVLHALVVAALIAGCVYLGVKLYDQFYLPYNLVDTPVTPVIAALESPSTQGVLRTAGMLQQRLASSSTSHLPEVFWPLGVPTSTKR